MEENLQGRWPQLKMKFNSWKSTKLKLNWIWLKYLLNMLIGRLAQLSLSLAQLSPSLSYLLLDDAFDHGFSCFLTIENNCHKIRRYNLTSSFPDFEWHSFSFPHAHVTYVNIKQNDMPVWTLIRNLCTKVSQWWSCN